MKSTTSKSAEIRKLYDIGVPIAEIARRMDIRYQFAYNIVSKYKRGQVPRGKNNVGGENVINPPRKEKKVGTRMFSRMNYQVVRKERVTNVEVKFAKMEENVENIETNLKEIKAELYAWRGQYARKKWPSGIERFGILRKVILGFGPMPFC